MPSQKQAESYVKEAQEALKTTLFKWKPDETTASYNYKKAAEEFRSLKKYQDSNNYYRLAIENFKILNQPYHAAQCYENIANNYKFLNELKSGSGFGTKIFDEEGLSNFVKNLSLAGEYFSKNESYDSTFHILNRGSTAIETQISALTLKLDKNLVTRENQLKLMDKLTSGAVELRTIANSALITSDKIGRSQDISSNISVIAKLYLRLYNLTKNEQQLTKIIPILLERNHLHALASIENNINPDILGKYASEIILIHLANDDIVSAKKFWDAAVNGMEANPKITGAQSGDEARTIADAIRRNHGFEIVNNLLIFWADDHGPKTQEYLKNFYFKNLETEYVKMVQNMDNVPTGMGTIVDEKNLDEKQNADVVQDMDTFLANNDMGFDYDKHDEIQESSEDDLC